MSMKVPNEENKMKKVFIIIFYCIVCIACINIPEHPVYIAIINHTNEKIWVTNLPMPISIGMTQATQVNKGSRVEVTGVDTKHSYGSRIFHSDSEWEIR